MSAVEEGLDLYSEMRRSPVGRTSVISISLDPEQPFSSAKNCSGTLPCKTIIEIVQSLICTDFSPTPSNGYTVLPRGDCYHKFSRC